MPRVVVIGNKMQHSNQQNPDRTVEIDNVPDFPRRQQVQGTPDITLDSGSSRRFSENGAGMSGDHGVAVRVHHPGLRVNRPRDLMHRPASRSPAPISRN